MAGDIIMEGPVKKISKEVVGGGKRKRMRKWMKPWRQRWVWFTEREDGEGELFYAAKKGANPLGCIKTSEMNNITALTEKQSSDEGLDSIQYLGQCFAILCSKKRYIFAALDRQCNAWVELLSRYIVGNTRDQNDSSDEESAGSAFSNDSSNDSDPLSTKKHSEYSSSEDDEEFIHTPRRKKKEHAAPSTKHYLDTKKHEKCASIARPDRITFSSKVFKLSSKDKEQERLVFIAASTLYILRQGEFRAHTTKVPIYDITHVMFNSKKRNQLAIIYPDVHDYLLIFATEEMSKVFVEILDEAFQLTSSERIQRRNSEDILNCIKRSVKDTYAPLTTAHGRLDSMGMASARLDVYPQLRMNGDSSVTLSQRVYAEGLQGQELKILVCTDQALYFFTPSGAVISSRSEYKDVQALVTEPIEGFILVQCTTGDKLFKPIDHQESPQDSFYGIFIKYFMPEIPVRAQTKAKIWNQAKLGKDIATATTFLTNRLINEGSRSIRKALKGNLKKVGGKVGEHLVDLKQATAKHLLSEFRTHGAGLAPELEKAADLINVPTACLTSSRGNAVFQCVNDVEYLHRLEDAGKSSRPSELAKMVEETHRFHDEPENQGKQKKKIRFAANCIVDGDSHEKIIIITADSIHIYAGDSKPFLVSKDKEFFAPLRELVYIVECHSEPKEAIIGFKSRDLLVRMRTSDLFKLKAYLVYRFSRSKQNWQMRTVDFTKQLRIVARNSEAESFPQVMLESCHCDFILLAECEAVIALLTQYNEIAICFSGTADGQLAKRVEGNQREFERKKYFVAVTRTAVYLIRRDRKDDGHHEKRLEISKRVPLPYIAGIRVNTSGNQDVLLQTLYCTVTIRYKAEPDNQMKLQEFWKTPKHIIALALEKSYKLADRIFLKSVHDRLVFEIFPATFEDVQRLTTLLTMCRNSSLLSSQFGDIFAPFEEQDISTVRDDVLLHFEPTKSEDFISSLCNSRLDWTPYDMLSDTAAQILCEIPILYTDQPEGFVRGSGNALTPYAKTPSDLSDPVLTCHFNPSSVGKAHDRWIQSRLDRVLHTVGTADVTFELQRGERLGLIKPDDQREIINRARLKAASVETDDLQVKALELIEQEQFINFDENIEELTTILTSDMISYENKVISRTTLYQSTDSRSTTVKHAKELTIQDRSCIGFVHNGGADVSGDQKIIFFFAPTNGNKSATADSPAKFLSNMLGVTTWLKTRDPIASLKEKRDAALENMQAIEATKRDVSAMLNSGKGMSKIDCDHVDILLSKLATDSAKGELKLQFSAAIQMVELKRCIMQGASSAYARRMFEKNYRSLTCYNLPEEYHVNSDLSKSAYQIYCSELEYQSLAESDPIHATSLNIELDKMWLGFESKLSELKEDTPGVDPPNIEELIYNLVTQKWVTEAEELCTISWQKAESKIVSLSKPALETCRHNKTIKKMIAEDRPVSAFAAIQSTDTDVLKSVENAKVELENWNERCNVKDKAKNILKTCSKVVTTINQLSDNELLSHLHSLQSILPEIEKFQSLESKRRTLDFLRQKFEIFHAEAERNRKLTEETNIKQKALQLTHEKRLQALQNRLQSKETLRIEKEDRIAKKALQKAKRVSNKLDQMKAVPSPDTSYLSKLKQNCYALLADTKVNLQTIDNKDLKTAMEILESSLELCDFLIGGKAEQKRKALVKYIDEVLSSNDEEAYLAFLKLHIDELDPESLCKISKAWGGYRLKITELHQACKALSEGIASRNKYDLQKSIEECNYKGLDPTDELLLEGIEVLKELDEQMFSQLSPSGNNDSDVDKELPDQIKESEASPNPIIIATPPQPTDDDNDSESFVASTVDEEEEVEPEPEPQIEEQQPKETEVPLAPSNSPHLTELRKALVEVQQNSERDAGGLLRCIPCELTDNYVDAWKACITTGLKKKTVSFFKKTDRNVIDVFEEIRGTSFPTEQAMGEFTTTKKRIQTKLDVNTLFLHYLMHSGRFSSVIQDVIFSEKLKDLYASSECLFSNHKQFFADMLLPLSTFRFDFKYVLSADDEAYLIAIDADHQPPELPEEKQKIENQNDNDPSSPSISTILVNSETPTSTIETAASPDVKRRQSKPDIDLSLMLSDKDGFHATTDPLIMLRIAVKYLSNYYITMKGSGTKHKMELFDEGVHHTVGIIVRERLCPAVTAVMASGFLERPPGMIKILKGTTRHLWHFIEASNNKKSKCFGDTGSKLLGQAIPTVQAVIEKKISKSASRSERSINDLKLRALICYSVNFHHLKLYIETLFDMEEENQEFLKKWYSSNALLLSKDHREELLNVLSLLGRIEFHLHLDADIW